MWRAGEDSEGGAQIGSVECTREGWGEGREGEQVDEGRAGSLARTTAFLGPCAHFRHVVVVAGGVGGTGFSTRGRWGSVRQGSRVARMRHGRGSGDGIGGREGGWEADAGRQGRGECEFSQRTRSQRGGSGDEGGRVRGGGEEGRGGGEDTGRRDAGVAWEDIGEEEEVEGDGGRSRKGGDEGRRGVGRRETRGGGGREGEKGGGGRGRRGNEGREEGEEVRGGDEEVEGGDGRQGGRDR